MEHSKLVDPAAQRDVESIIAEVEACSGCSQCESAKPLVAELRKLQTEGAALAKRLEDAFCAGQSRGWSDRDEEVAELKARLSPE